MKSTPTCLLYVIVKVGRKLEKMEEIWRDITGYEGLYQISNFGNVRSLERTIEHTSTYGGTYHIKGKKLNPKLDKGYLRIGLRKNGIKKYYAIHRLVAKEFLNNPYNYEIIKDLGVNSVEETDFEKLVNIEAKDYIKNAKFCQGN